MDKKAMVLAVGAALAAPSALAQYTSPAGSAWEFYGKFYPEMTTTSGAGATPLGQTVATMSRSAQGQGAIINRWEMQISNSYIGFRANKDLGRGLRAIAQLETTVPIDEGTVTANSAGLISTLGNRDSFAGLAADWGTIRLGNMDTPFKKYGDTVGFLGVSSGNLVSPNNVMRRVSNSGPSGFNLRRANAIDFASQSFGGLQVGVQYSIGNPTEAGTTTPTTGTAPGAPLGSTPAVNSGIDPAANRDPRVISMAAKWEQGPFYAAIAFERHFDLFGGSGIAGNGSATTSNAADPFVRSRDSAAQATGVYKLGDHSIELDVGKKVYQEKGATVTGRFQEYKNLSYEAVIESRWTSQWRTSLAYIKANAGNCTAVNAACTTSGMDAKQYNVGVAYFFDPSAYLFALYSKVFNGSSARYNNTAVQAPNVGEDIVQVAGGIAYTF